MRITDQVSASVDSFNLLKVPPKDFGLAKKGAGVLPKKEMYTKYLKSSDFIEQ